MAHVFTKLSLLILIIVFYYQPSMNAMKKLLYEPNESTRLIDVCSDVASIPSYTYVAQQLGITDEAQKRTFVSRCCSWLNNHLPVCTILGGLSFWALWLAEAIDGDNPATIVGIILMAAIDTGLGTVGYCSNEDRVRVRLLKKFLCDWDKHKSRTPVDLHPLIEYIKKHQGSDDTFIAPDNEFIKRLLCMVRDHFVDVEVGIRYEEAL